MVGVHSRGRSALLIDAMDKWFHASEKNYVCMQAGFSGDVLSLFTKATPRFHVFRLIMLTELFLKEKEKNSHQSRNLPTKETGLYGVNTHFFYGELTGTVRVCFLSVAKRRVCRLAWGGFNCRRAALRN